MSIAFKYRTNTVELTRDSTGETVVIDMAGYKANEQFYVDQHLDPPVPPEPTTEERIEQLTAALAEAQKDIAAHRQTLIDKGVADAAEIDDRKPKGDDPDAALLAAFEDYVALLAEKEGKPYYQLNKDGSVSYYDKDHKLVATFNEDDPTPEASLYRTWKNLGGKPLPPDPSIKPAEAEQDLIGAKT